MSKGAVAVLALFFSALAPAAAEPYADAVAAYERGDYATALRLLRPLANQCDFETRLGKHVFVRQRGAEK